MPIRVDLEAALAARGLKAKDVAAQVGISETQFSLFRSGKIKGVRFATLARLCAVLGCDLAGVLTYEFDPEDLTRPPTDQSID